MHTPGPWVMAHTPGPWKIHARHIGREIVCGDYGDIDIATVWGPEANVDANATLIAAAPDLLAALEELVSLKDGPRDDNYEQEKPRAWQAARAAIAKATGQPPAAQAGKEE